MSRIVNRILAAADALNKVDQNVASIAANVSQAIAKTTPTTAPTTTIGAAETVLQTTAAVAASIPGLQATTLAQLLTLSVQFVNLVESIKTDVQNAHPEVWAEIEGTFSSAVKAFDLVPKK